MTVKSLIMRLAKKIDTAERLNVTGETKTGNYKLDCQQSLQLSLYLGEKGLEYSLVPKIFMLLLCL